MQIAQSRIATLCIHHPISIAERHLDILAQVGVVVHEENRILRDFIATNGLGLTQIHFDSNGRHGSRGGRQFQSEERTHALLAHEADRATQTLYQLSGEHQSQSASHLVRLHGIGGTVETLEDIFPLRPRNADTPV